MKANDNIEKRVSVKANSPNLLSAMYEQAVMLQQTGYRQCRIWLFYIIIFYIEILAAVLLVNSK